MAEADPQIKLGAHERFLIAGDTQVKRRGRYATIDEARAVIGTTGVNYGPFGSHSAEEMAQAMFRAFGPLRPVAPVTVRPVEPNPRILELYRMDRAFTPAETVEWEALTGEAA